MDKKDSVKTAKHPKALPRRTGAKLDTDSPPASAASPPDKMHISKNERGELTLSKGGAIRLNRTFLGSNASAGQDSTELDNARFAQVACALPGAKGKCDDPQVLNIALDGVEALAPRDGMEVMLCSQLVALHSQGMDFLRRAMIPDQTIAGIDINVNRASKTLRTFATMAECLRTYRGGGQQKMTVEHVTVNAGGQAIVGTVNRGAGGDAEQNRG